MPLGGKMIWDFLLHKIGNPYGAAGLMGNLCAESALDPTKLERTAEKKLGVSSAEYTARVDDGRYDAERFAHDGAGYGLAQWTYHARKAALLTYAKECGVSIGSLAMQLEYLWKELQGYKTVLKVLRAAVSVREASDIVMTRYEKPKNQSESARSKRQRYGQKYFDAYACKGVWEMYNPQAVIDAALNEVGYLEKATIAQLDNKTANAGSKNYTKYARDLYAAQYFNGNKQGASWCAVFVAWCFYKAFGKNAALTLLCQPTRDNCGRGVRVHRAVLQGAEAMAHEQSTARRRDCFLRHQNVRLPAHGDCLRGGQRLCVHGGRQHVRRKRRHPERRRGGAEEIPPQLRADCGLWPSELGDEHQRRHFRQRRRRK